jgi:hypothetical protein
MSFERCRRQAVPQWMHWSTYDAACWCIKTLDGYAVTCWKKDQNHSCFVNSEHKNCPIFTRKYGMGGVYNTLQMAKNQLKANHCWFPTRSLNGYSLSVY